MANKQTLKSQYYKELKEAGVQFSKPYRQYTVDELEAGMEKLRAARAQREAEALAAAEQLQQRESPLPPFEEPAPAPAPQPQAQAQQPPPSMADLADAAVPPVPQAPVAERDPNEMAGQRLNTKDELEPIRTDPETGFIWFQEEVLKPGFAKPRGRRVLRTQDSAAKKVTVQSGEYTETFEVAGDGPRQATEVKITLPSYQTGIYLDPRYPFKIHTYNGVKGFDFFEVGNYYGGIDLVPPGIKRMYVENVLCWDIRTTILAINQEYRQLQLTGRIEA